MGAPRLQEIRARLTAGVGDGSCTWMPEHVRTSDVQALLTIAERAEAVLRELQDYMDLHDHDPLYLPSHRALASALGWTAPDA